MHGWGACMMGGVHGGGGINGRGEVCMAGGVHGRGVCVAGGHVWQGGMHGRGACVAGGGQDTFNERAVRILLECILVKCINLIGTAVYFAAYFCPGNSIKSSVSLKVFAIDVFQHKYKNARLRTECGPS